MSYVELDAAVRELSAGLAALRVRPGDHVALLAETRPEHIRRFAVLERELSMESGERTPTPKVRRTVVNERYAEVIDALYG